MSGTSQDDRNRTTQLHQRIRLRDRIMNKSMPMQPVERAQIRGNRSLRAAPRRRVRPINLTTPNQGPQPHVQSRIPESDVSEYQMRPSLVGAFMDETSKEYDPDETFGHESDFSEINEILDQTVNNIFSPYERAEKVPIKMRSLRQSPETNATTYNRSLPSQLVPHQLPVPTIVEAERSLNAAYQSLLRHVDEEENQENIMNETYDLASESFEEVERRIAAEDAAASAFAARHNTSGEDLDDISLQLVDD